MKLEHVPIIRMEIEQMKYSIMKALGIRGSELGEIMEKEIDNAIASYDFNMEISTIVHSIITTEIKNCLVEGLGAEFIKAAIKNVLKEIFSKTGEENENDN